MDMNTFPILLAAAATTPPPDVPVFGDFAKILNPMFDAAKGYSDVLVPAGQVMLSIALVLETMMLTFDYFVKGGSGSDFLHGAFRIFLVALLPATMLATWPELPNAILSLFASQLPAILNGASPGDSGTDHMAHAFSGVLHAMQDIFAPPRLEGKQHWWDVLGKTELAIYKVAAVILLSVPMLIFGFALIITLFGPLFMLYIGVIMAPILVPWMVFKPLSNMGMTWIKYMVTMGVAFVIGLVMAGIVMKSVQDYASVVNGQGDTLGSFAALIFGLFPQMIMLLFLAYMMIKAEQIAAAMVGGASIGGGGAMAAMMGAALAKGGGGKDGKAGGTGGDAKGAGGGADNSGGAQQAGQGKSAATDQASLSKGAAEAGASGTSKASGGGSQAELSKGAGETGAAGTSKGSGAGASSIWLGEADSGSGAAGSAVSGEGAAPAEPGKGTGGAEGGSADAGTGGGGQKGGEVGPSGKGDGGGVSRFGPGAKKAAKTAGKIAVGAVLPPVGMAMAAYTMSPRVRRMTDSGVSKVKSGAQAVAGLAMPKKADKGDAPSDAPKE